MTDEQADRIVAGVKKGRMSELEAREIGDKAQKLLRLRTLLKCGKSGKLVIEHAINATESISLSAQDLVAMLNTQIDRETTWLIAMNVDVEP